MQSSRKKSVKNITKYVIAGALTFSLSQIPAVVKAQGPPGPPPPPSEVFRKAGNGLKKINPFKKSKRRSSNSRSGLPAPGTPPPPPPNPLKIFKKGTPAPPRP